MTEIDQGLNGVGELSNSSLAFSSDMVVQVSVAMFCIFAFLVLWRPYPRCHFLTKISKEGATDQDFGQSLACAYNSALTKFDSLSTYFSKGMTFDAVVTMLVDEILLDHDFAHSQDELKQKAVVKFVKENVGRAFGAWKKRPRDGELTTGEVPQNTLLSWPSIENYPDWVHDQINTYLQASSDEKTICRLELERTLLETPLWSVSTKYDGTCFGKMDNGEFVGRRHVVGACQTYQQTSTIDATGCDVGSLKDELSRILHIELGSGSVCVWGELMCNPGYYNYRARGLAEQWLPFGVVLQMPEAVELQPLLGRLQEEDLAYSVGEGSGRLRLSMCRSLRRLLQDVAKCRVVEEVCEATTHAEVVAKGAKDLMEGHNEGALGHKVTIRFSQFYKTPNLFC